MSADASPRARARRSLDGLSIGDAFGETFAATLAGAQTSPARRLPPGPWRTTDDTVMALSIVENLETHESIEPDALAQAFAARFVADPNRGYGRGAQRLLRQLAEGGDWRDLARAAFRGEGSLGNGAAMRAAPIGAYYAGDPERAAQEAALSARVTHAHPDGVAGAQAVAVAGALVHASMVPGERLAAVAQALAPSPVRDALEQAATLSECAPSEAAARLGNGARVTALDTVPFALWQAAHAPDFERALWSTAEAGGDTDTTCAIVGGLVALRSDAAVALDAWRQHREPLDLVG
ncbi:MAG: ADP-ribosylglycohydrolase family protein [Myxococcota bacterium]